MAPKTVWIATQTLQYEPGGNGGKAYAPGDIVPAAIAKQAPHAVKAVATAGPDPDEEAARLKAEEAEKQRLAAEEAERRKLAEEEKTKGQA